MCVHGSERERMVQVGVVGFFKDSLAYSITAASVSQVLQNRNRCRPEYYYRYISGGRWPPLVVAYM